MSTPRRRLGTGPTAPASDPQPGAGPRLLPVEQADPDVRIEHEAVPARGARRPLGSGGAGQ
jgi:hypothetical protein